MKLNIASLITAILLAGCAQQAKIAAPPTTSTPARSAINLYDGDPVYFVYKKDASGTPTSLVLVSKDQKSVVKSFSNNTFKIDDTDCISITAKPKNGHEEATCDASMWREYYSNDKTVLLTRTAKNPVDAVFDGVAGIAFSPLGMLADAASGDGSMKNTQRMLKGSTTITEDYEVLAQVHRVIDVLATEKFMADKKEAMQDTSTAMAFFKKYPQTAFRGNDQAEVIQANIKHQRELKSESGLNQIITTMSLSKEDKESALSALRDIGTFQAYAYAFNASGQESDAKNANKKAVRPEQKKQVEYMFSKVLETKSPGSLAKLFAVRPVSNVNNSSVSASEGGNFFTRSQREGKANFTAIAEVTANRDAGVVEYSSYDVTIRATVHVPRSVYQRSNWLGNRDAEEVATTSADTVIRLSPPDYQKSQKVAVNGVVLTMMERGIMGGVKQIQQTGDPTMTLEVVSAKAVQ